MTTAKVIKILPQKAENDNKQVYEQQYSYWYYLKVCLWSKFFCFKGRARRKEYITFQLADLAVAAVFYGLIYYGGFQNETMWMTRDIVNAVLIIPLLSVSVRRFHDVGLSGWWCCLGVVPYVAMAFLAVKESNREENKYGAVPEGKTFGQPLWARYMNRDKTASDNVVDFNLQKKKAKQTKRAA